MANLNKVMLIGRLTKDPPEEPRYTSGGTAVCELGLAVNREFTTADGTRKKETCFVDIVFWARRAEVVCKYLRKGSAIFVEGRLELDQWEDRQTGQKRSRLRVVADNFQFLDRAGDSGGSGRQESRGRPEPASAPAGSDGGRGGGGDGGDGGGGGGGRDDQFALDEDDVPF